MLYIFDLDGTLLDTIGDLASACDESLRQKGYPLHSYEEYASFVGNGINKLIERALPQDAQTQENVLELREHFVAYYNVHNCDKTHPYEGINEVLETLKKREGVKLAVASNKYQQATEKIVNHFFPKTFDIILGERAQKPRKPDPQIVYDILEKLEVKKEDVLYIGDSVVDVQTAKNAGVRTAACSWGFCSKEQLASYKPDYLLENPLEILEI